MLLLRSQSRNPPPVTLGALLRTAIYQGNAFISERNKTPTSTEEALQASTHDRESAIRRLLPSHSSQHEQVPSKRPGNANIVVNKRGVHPAGTGKLGEAQF